MPSFSPVISAVNNVTNLQQYRFYPKRANRFHAFPPARPIGSGKSGLCSRLGSRVKKDQPVGVISDPFGGSEVEVLAPYSGVVIGCTNLPLANEGEALFHVARFQVVADAAVKVEAFQKALAPDNDAPL